MKRFLVLTAALASFGTATFADDAFGTWQTIKDDNGKYGHIKVSACGDKICGKLIKSFNSDGTEYKSENVGKNLIWNMKNKGDGKYAGGKVWSPDRDKTYKGKLVLMGDKLTVKGCVGPICRNGGTWSRVK